MMTSTFSAQRQLIFHVSVGGCSRLVQFGERNAYGSSSFITSDEAVAAAIRQTSMYRRGVITEQTVKEVSATVGDALRKTVGSGGDALRRTAGNGGEGNSQQTAVDDEANVIEADNFTQAKEAFMKLTGVDKSKVKTPMMLAKMAKEHGITIRYREK